VSAEGRPASPPQPVVSPIRETSSAHIPTSVRLAFEIQKPKDWQAFQRNCVVLFREELHDVHAMEYGRNGQKQHGIDIKANRNGDPAHLVGIQCRRYDSPLKYKAMLQDCRDAAKHFVNLKEFIFATTSPDDARLTDDVTRVESQLLKDGYSIRVVLYGWEQLQQVISRHPPAYDLFSPAGQAALTPTPKVDLHEALQGGVIDALATRLAGLLGPQFQVATPPLPPGEPENLPKNATDEDPILHGRIDAYRDILTKDGQPDMARRGFLALKEKANLDGKPWARYRIEANLGAVEYHLGNEDRAIELFEAAYELRPQEPTAKAHLALARLSKGRYEEAVALARAALDGTPRPEHALTCLIQATALSGLIENLEALIPEDLKGTVSADLGLAEAYRQRRVPDWQARCIELARRHPEVQEFVPVNALAVLSFAIESEATVPGGVGPVSADDLNKATDEMRAFVGHLLDIGYSDQGNLGAHLNNTCVLLRLCGRNEEAEALLKRAPNASRQDPILRRQMAVTLSALDRPLEAITLLEGDEDSENQLFRLQLLAASNPQAALDGALALEAAGLCSRLAWLRWNLIAEMGLRTQRLDVLPEAITELRRADPSDPAPGIFELRIRRLQGLDDEEFEEELTRIAGALPSDAPMASRCFVAVELKDADLPEQASLLLDGHVDLSRVSPTAVFYLKSLAQARRDDAFRKALEMSTPRLRHLPEVLWATAAHAWNTGDLEAAHDAVTKLVNVEPRNLAARLFKIQVLLRQNKRPLVEDEVRQPLETMSTSSIKERLEVVALLSHFNFVERAADLAYKLFLENRDDSRVWMSLAGVVLGEGRSGPRDRDLWRADTVGPNIAVDLAYEDGSTAFFVVEPDVSLRRLDDEAREPSHPIVRRAEGLAVGAEFSDPSARKVKVAQLRHKVVARFHKVLAEYERRFPERQGFRSMKVAPNEPGGLDEMMAVLKARSEWFNEEQQSYLEGEWPLGLLAARLGSDVIDAAEALAAQGIQLRTAAGDDEDREAASQAIIANKRRGVVLDLHSFWTAWRLGILEVVTMVGGPIHIGQKVLDRLRSRRENLAPCMHDGSKHASFENGRIVLHEVAPEAVRARMEDVSQAIEWVETRATVCPLIAGDDLPADVREHLGVARSDVYDALVLAKTRNLLLVTDDLTVRRLGHVIDFSLSCWTQAILADAQSNGHMTRDRYVRSLAALIGAGHSYLSINADDLIGALIVDAADGEAPGPTFRHLSENIGGKKADPVSHVHVVFQFLRVAWSSGGMTASRKGATSLLLRQLIRYRHHDYGAMLAAIFRTVPRASELGQFLRYWQVGHFITNEAIFGPALASSSSRVRPSPPPRTSPAPPQVAGRPESSGRRAAAAGRRRHPRR